MTTEAEIELCYMVEVTDPSGFEKASAMEMHQQYEYKLPPDEQGNRRGKIRIRKTTKNNESVFSETIKTPMNVESLLGDQESTTEISEAFYNAWRHVYRASGQQKIRYCFMAVEATMVYQGNEVKLPPVKFEVDVFLDPRGRKSKWAKVDIEVQDIVKMLKEQYEDVDAAKFEIKFDCLPLGVNQVVSMATKNSEERAAIDNFFKMYAIPYEVSDVGQGSSTTA